MIGILNLNGVETLSIFQAGGRYRTILICAIIFRHIEHIACSTVSRPPKLRIHNTGISILYCCCIRPNCVIIPAGTMGEHPASHFEVACPEAVGAIHALQLCCRQGITLTHGVQRHIPFSQHFPFAVFGYEEPDIPGFICCLRTGCRNIFRQSVLNQILDTYRCSILGSPSIDTVVHAINYEVGSSQLLAFPGGNGQGDASIQVILNLYHRQSHSSLFRAQPQHHFIGIGVKFHVPGNHVRQLCLNFLSVLSQGIPLALRQGRSVGPGRLVRRLNRLLQGTAGIHLHRDHSGFPLRRHIPEGYAADLALNKLCCKDGILSKDSFLCGQLEAARPIGVLPSLEHLSLRCRHRRQCS